MHVCISDVSSFSKDHSMEPILELFEAVFYITDMSYLRINPRQMKAQKYSLGTSILQQSSNQMNGTILVPLKSSMY